MLSPEASDFAWIFVVKPARERPSACPSCPPLLRPQTRARARSSSRMRCADESSRRACRGERVEEGFDDASLAQSVEAFPYAVARTEAFRQGAPPNILDREEVERFEETAIVAGLPPASWKAGAKHCARVRPILLAHFCRQAPRPPIRSGTKESQLIHLRNPKISSNANSSTRPSHPTARSIVAFLNDGLTLILAVRLRAANVSFGSKRVGR